MSLANDPSPGPLATVLHLLEATNRHDLDALVECFSPQYVNETPAHPLRGFTGREQVRRNWAQIFAAAPDTAVTLTGHSVTGPHVWAELVFDGTLPDGSRNLLAGVIIFRVEGGSISSARFYLEPVERVSGSVGDAIGRLAHGASPRGGTP
ncbi:MAG TPA: nuclear transport factor 2 family protein [Arthrobacter sp.]|jgi:ketosteroid isomerase-like protein